MKGIILRTLLLIVLAFVSQACGKGGCLAIVLHGCSDVSAGQSTRISSTLLYVHTKLDVNDVVGIWRSQCHALADDVTTQIELTIKKQDDDKPVGTVNAVFLDSNYADSNCTLLSTRKTTPFEMRFNFAAIPATDSPKETPVTRRFSTDFVSHQIEVNDYGAIEKSLLESKIAAANNDANTVSIDDSNESLVTITSTNKSGDIYSAIALHDPNQLTDKQRLALATVNDGNRTKRLWLGKMKGVVIDDGTTKSKRHDSFRFSTPLFKVEVEPTTKSDA